MGKNDFSNLGEEIDNLVQNAVGNMDFHKLNKDISDTISSAMSDVKKTLEQGMSSETAYAEKPKRVSATVVRDRNGRYRKVIQTNGNERTADKRNSIREYRENVKTPIVNPLVSSSPKGRLSNKLLTIFGGIGTFAFATTELVLTIVALAAGVPEMGWGILGFAPALLLSLSMLLKGNAIRKRLNRYYCYVRTLHGRTYCSIRELAVQVGKREKYVAKDLRLMISQRMFPEGRLDEQETCLMLNHESYEQYLHAQEALRQRQVENIQDKVVDSHVIEEQEQEDELARELREAIEEGNEYIRQIRAANQEIPGEEISKKLDTLEAIISKMFEHIAEHEEKLPEMRKFMSYYLPTTLKLVNAYKEFDKQSIQGDNIKKGKLEIEQTIDTINAAFVNLFDSLFADEAMDISTDISVLRTMLAQEGLTESDFRQE